MSYVALYRKWRPRVFEDVVGQGHITQTLKNQIKNENIAHAYLFCGTRGTGKTSTAKILARAVNCLNTNDYNPCNTCEICRGIQQESIMDVMEIDAASNNGVDDIRELRENVKYPPTKGRYKVYIIDEVHMLSTGAFNALLKTLEEPPQHVLFILATTEPHKIPATILSRCQRFDFKRVKEEDMVGRLSYILKESHVEVEDAALKLIARNADGAMRDALSILDQCISFGTGVINYDDVMNILGTVSDDFMFNLVDHIGQNNAKGAMELIEELVASGKDLQQFIRDMIHHYRNLMMTKVAQNLEGMINLSKESIDRLKKQGDRFETQGIVRAIHVLSQTEADAKWSSQPRVLLEVGVIKLTQPTLDQSVEGLLERIQTLEKMMESGNVKFENHGNKQEKSVGEESKTDAQERNPEIQEVAVPGVAINFEGLGKVWDKILKEVKKRKISTHAVLMEGSLADVEGNTLIISFKDGFGFHREATGNSPNKEFIEQIIKEMVGHKLHLKCVMEDQLKETPRAQHKDSTADEEVEKIIALFGKDVVEIIE